MKKNLLYLDYIFRHKLYVFVAGVRLGVPLWRLIVHDWSKFSRVEWVAYREFFYGVRTPEVKKAFKEAWAHHIHLNPHHWNNWLYVDTDGQSVLEMPEIYALEMLADWYGAGRAIRGTWDPQNWYAIHRDKIVLHPSTRRFVEQELKSNPFERRSSSGKGLGLPTR